MGNSKVSTEKHPIVWESGAVTPFAAHTSALLDAAPAAHTYGAASMQSYANGQVAYNTHASADGFLAYVNQFEQTSFRVKDGQVKWWQYSPTYDDWMDSYGCDAVEVFYHAGHGGTDSATGEYSAPLGGTWAGQSSLASRQMSIGDQRLRYLFLATCQGCMVFAPDNPIRTWNVPNRGIRMLFGATANIYDNPDYGTNLWNHWRTGSSFSQAWQDALLDAGSGQQPSSVACGATAQDASTRLFNERFFTNTPAPRDWYWWRWVGPAPALGASLALEVPKDLHFARIAPRRVDRSAIEAAFAAHGHQVTMPDGPLEGMHASTPRGRLAVLPGGDIVIEHHAAQSRRSTLTVDEAIAVAAELVSQEGHRLTAVLPAWHAGATAAESYEPEIFEHVVVFRQEVAGLTVLTPGAGELRVHVDADGQVRRLVDSRLRGIEVTDAGPWPTTSPTPSGRHVRSHRLTTLDEIIRALQLAARRSGEGRARRTSRKVLTDSVRFGYALRGTSLVPVARADVQFGNESYQMLDAVEVDLL